MIRLQKDTYGRDFNLESAWGIQSGNPTIFRYIEQALFDDTQDGSIST